MAENPYDPDDVFIADPSEVEAEADQPAPPGWPKTVGIISIVLGALNFTCAGVGAGWQFVQPGFMRNLDQQMQGGVPPALLSTNPMLVAAGIAGVVWSAFLIVAGAVTVARKPIGRWLHLVYAVVAIVLTAWGVKVQLDYQAQIAEWIRQNPDSQFAQQAGAGTGSLIALVVGIALGLAWPLFCLVWFGLVKRSAESMTGGVEEPAA